MNWFDTSLIVVVYYSYTNGSHEGFVEFCVIEVFKFWVRCRYEENKSDKTLSLGMPKAPQVNIQGRSKQLSLGMPRKASPLSSPTLSVTSLGAMFSFVT